MEIKFEDKSFDELTTTELYDILALRSEIFVVEQDCVYQDIDHKDQKARHIIGKVNHQIVAYARCFYPGYYFEEAAIGRVLVKETYRNRGFAHQLIDFSINRIQENFKTSEIKISAQTYLKTFYQAHKFQQIGEGYLEDGIPHIGMIRK